MTNPMAGPNPYRVRAWLQAARPLAQGNIAVPLLYGQALALATCGEFSWGAFALTHLFGVLDQLFIVFANDAADADGDRAHDSPTLLSGGSRVIPEGKLTQRHLALAALVMVGLMGALGVLWTLYFQRLLMLLFVAVAVWLLWAYSFPPLRLSHRGQGEWLQAIGTGAVLPAIGFHAHCPDPLQLPVLAFLPTVILGYASNISTALPDTTADRACGKRSAPVRWGERVARVASVALIGVGAAVALRVIPALPPSAGYIAIAGVTLVLAFNVPLLGSADCGTGRCFRFALTNGVALNTAIIAWTIGLFLVG